MSDNIKKGIKFDSKNIWLVLVITTTMTLILGTTYAYLELGGTSNATGTAGCFNVTYTGQAINNSNLSVTTAYNLTEAQTTVKLNKASNCEIYTEADIKLFTDSNITAPISSPQALKYKVVKTSGNGTIKSGGEGIITSKGASTTLATVSLTETQTTYTIYLWIDSSISNGYYDQKTYSGYIYAESKQSSTITE